MHSMAPSASSKPFISPRHPPNFIPIQEGNEEEDYSSQAGSTSFRTTTPSNCNQRDHPTPLHQQSSSDSRSSVSTRKKPETNDVTGDDGGVLCNKCRPSNREKMSVVPLDNNGVNNRAVSIKSPNGLFNSIFSSLVKKSPRSSDVSSTATAREEQWKNAVTELSNKLKQATRKRDEAILESSKVKYSMAELEKKLNKLEIYCANLNSGLEMCSNGDTTNSLHQINRNNIAVSDHEKVIEHFLVSVSEARTSVRLLSRSLIIQLRQMSEKVYHRISILLQPYDVKISLSRNQRGILFYLEALLNKSFLENFESIGFQKNSPNPILNPIDRCEANFASFNRLQGLTWEEVLNKGTKHFSEDFSRFCDRKMSEIVAMLEWNRAWPEPLLQAFFGASKNVWLVHLLANSVHPSLPIFRVDEGVGFDSVYMEDMGRDKARKLAPTMVRIMVAPGFYVYENLVKCKVLCRYYNDNGTHNDCSEKGLTSSPVQPTI